MRKSRERDPHPSSAHITLRDIVVNLDQLQNLGDLLREWKEKRFTAMK